MTCTTTNAQTGHPIHALASRLGDRLSQIRRRKGLKRLLDKDDNILADIGVTRGEIQIATSMPLSVDAATELRRLSLERRRTGM